MGVVIKTGCKTQDPLADPTNKEMREEENRQAIGGLRNPLRSVQKLPGWQPVGTRIAGIIDSINRLYGDTIQKVQTAIKTGKPYDTHVK